MHNIRSILILGILIFLFLFSTGCTQTKAPAPPSAPAGTPVETKVPAVTTAAPLNATKEDMVAFEQEAVAYARKNGKEKALAEFSNRNGLVFQGVFYIYAYDHNATTIAHPVNSEKIGINRLKEENAEGTCSITNLRQAVNNGTGFITYTYINPVYNNTVEKKLGYAKKIDDSWWLGSGIYIGPANISVPVITMQPAQKISLFSGR